MGSAWEFCDQLGFEHCPVVANGNPVWSLVQLLKVLVLESSSTVLAS